MQWTVRGAGFALGASGIALVVDTEGNAEPGLGAESEPEAVPVEAT